MPVMPQNTSLGGGRRLGDGPSDSPPVPLSTPIIQRPTSKPTTQKRFATLGDFSSGGANNGDADDDQDPQDLFAGGEKSALAVQNPDDIKKKILEKAMKRQKPTDQQPKAKSTAFTGTARTLGGEDAPSVEVAATPQPVAPPGRVERVLHFWHDGFSIDDGDLYSTEDPRNADILNGIRQGRAPLHIMNVMPGQEVDVEIKQHDEKYVKPKAKYKPFTGSGNRLGSPTPGVMSMPGAFTSELSEPAASTTSIAASSSAPAIEVASDLPTITLRITLGDGTRLTSRFNTTHTVGDVYDFVRRADTSGRPWVLQTTFPSKNLEDQTAILGETPELRKGGTVVQKFS